MKTTFHRNRRRQPSPFLLLSLLALLFLGGVYIARETLSGFIWEMYAPVASIHEGVEGGIAGFFAQLSSKAQLQMENKRLKEALATTSLLIKERELFVEENRRLKALLGREEERPPSILATVLLKPPATPYDTLIIDVGLEEGVYRGDVVSAGGRSVIGSVTEVYDNSARVTLTSAPGSSIDAHLSRIDRVIPVTLFGQGGGSLYGDVPAGTSVAVGESVTLTGLTFGFVGEVSHVKKEEGGSFETLYLHLPVNLFELRFVEVHHGSTTTQD